MIFCILHVCEDMPLNHPAMLGAPSFSSPAGLRNGISGLCSTFLMYFCKSLPILFLVFSSRTASFLGYVELYVYSMNENKLWYVTMSVFSCSATESDRKLVVFICKFSALFASSLIPQQWISINEFYKFCVFHEEMLPLHLLLNIF